MLLSLLFFVLLLAIALSQAAKGFFSALIMTVLTICCCAAAVATHEWIAVNALAPYWKPDFAHPLALGLTFGLSLIILRLIFDRLIRRSCLLPAWVDRAGGGVCGVITAEIMVGMIAVCLQMIPFDGGFLGYSRVTPVSRDQPGADSAKAKAGTEDRELLLTPDRFALATASFLSGGIFSGERLFYRDHPDFVQAVGWVNAVPAMVSRYAKPKSIAVVATEPVQLVYKMSPGSEKDRTPATYEDITAPKDRELRMIRVHLQAGARDERKSHLFTARQFRVVGRMPGSDIHAQFAPVAIQQEDATQPTNRHIRLIRERGSDWPVIDETVSPRGDDDRVELVFELPKGFEPSFLEYKRGARAPLSFGGAAAPRDTDAPKRGEAAGSATPSTPSGNVPDSGRGGNVRRSTTQAGKSTFGDQLPMEMKAYRRIGDTEVTRNKLANGHLVGEVDQQGSGTDPPLSKFEVPEDKRLLQLHTSFLEARSGLGRALSRAVAVAQNYTVVDDRGGTYPLSGKYAIATVGGTRVVEVQYASEEQGSMGGSLGAFDRIKDDDLKGDYQLVMLFLVNPGAKIVAFSTGGDATRRDDLTGENLTAPN